MNNIVIRRGKPEDADHFAELAEFTAPDYLRTVFGPGVKSILKKLFRRRKNLFSFEYSYFMEVDGEVAGMTLFYSHKDKSGGIAPLVFLLLRYEGIGFFLRLGALLKFADIFAQTKEGDLYSSNSALYPHFRGRGLGEELCGLSEARATALGLTRVVVEVKADNNAAIGLREKLGYRIEETLPTVTIKGKLFEYVKMVKELKPGAPREYKG